MQPKQKRAMEYILSELNMTYEERVSIVNHYKPINPNRMTSYEVLRQVWDNDSNFLAVFPSFSIGGSRSRYQMRLEIKRKDKHADSVSYTVLFWDDGTVDYSVNVSTTLDI